MALFGDHYTGTYEGHAIELVRNNWDKTLKLLIDGEVAASDTCHLPVKIVLTGSVSHHGSEHEVVATVVPQYVVFTKDTIEIDGNELELTHEAPKGITPIWVLVLLALAIAGSVAVGGAALLGRLR